jgi:CheY-like chemotaxis protein
VVDDRDYSSTLLLVEDNQNDVESTLATLSKGRPIEVVYIARDGEEALDSLLRRAAYRSQAAEREL